MARTGVALLVALVCACSTAPVVIPAQYREPPHAAKPAPLKGCPLQLASLKDLRADPGFLGRVAGREVVAADFPAWVRGGFEAGLGRPQADASAMALDVELIKAYVTPLPVSKSADIVTRVRFVRDSRVIAEKVYRGGHTSMNWASGEGETQQTLRLALEALVNEVRADALGHCAELRAQQAASP